jgi:galactofuranose transport system permease protein
VGTLIIQSLTTTILTRGIAPEVTLVFKAVVIIVVALIQSEKFRHLFSRQLAARKLTARKSPGPDVSGLS